MPEFKPPAPDYVGPADKFSQGSNKPIRRIVMHGTVSATVKGGARNIGRYFRSEAAGGSAHYVVDPGETVQVVYDGTIAWHAPPNSNSLGVELCDLVGGGANNSTPLPLSRWNETAHAEMLDRAARLVAELCLAYDIPPRMRGPRALRAGKRGICEHSDVSKAWRQSDHWDLGHFPRRRFAKMVRDEMRTIKKAATNPNASVTRARTAKVKKNRVHRGMDLVEQAYRWSVANGHPRRAARLKAGLKRLGRKV